MSPFREFLKGLHLLLAVIVAGAVAYLPPEWLPDWLLWVVVAWLTLFLVFYLGVRRRDRQVAAVVSEIRAFENSGVQSRHVRDATRLDSEPPVT